MIYDDYTKDDLIGELQHLRQEHSRLKALYHRATNIYGPEGQKLTGEWKNAEQTSHFMEGFPGRMHCEIGTPINGILGFSTIIQDSVNLNDNQKEVFKKIEVASTRLQTLIQEASHTTYKTSGQETILFPHNKSQPAKLKILFIIDTYYREDIINKFLQNSHHEISWSHPPDHAIKSCINSPGSDLVLIKMVMPEMEGLGAISQIRQFNKKAVIIAIIGWSPANIAKEVLAAGCDDYLRQPVEKNSFLALMHKYFPD